VLLSQVGCSDRVASSVNRELALSACYNVIVVFSPNAVANATPPFLGVFLNETFATTTAIVFWHTVTSKDGGWKG
jgi:hypothetical protein